MGSKPKTPAPTASEIEAERRARRELDNLTRDENARLKGLKRGRQGRRGLLGSGSERGVTQSINSAAFRRSQQGGGLGGFGIRTTAGSSGGKKRGGIASIAPPPGKVPGGGGFRGK